MSGTQHIQPPEVFSSQDIGFTQVVASPPGTLLFLSGQVAWDRDRKLIGEGDLGKQVEQALKNLGHTLAAAGATPSDVTMIRCYVAGYKPEHAAVLSSRLGDFFSGSPPPASTWIGVETLAAPDLLIEIETMAVIAS